MHCFKTFFLDEFELFYVIGGVTIENKKRYTMFYKFLWMNFNCSMMCSLEKLRGLDHS